MVRAARPRHAGLARRAGQWRRESLPEFPQLTQTSNCTLELLLCRDGIRPLTAARLLLLTYNLWSLFVTLLPGQSHREAITTRSELLMMAGQLTRRGRQQKLKPAASPAWWTQLRTGYDRLSAWLKPTAPQLDLQGDLSRSEWNRDIRSLLLGDNRHDAIKAPPVWRITSCMTIRSIGPDHGQNVSAFVLIVSE